MRRIRNAKVLATLGPASREPETIRSLFQAGADVFRLNFSHGSHEDHRNTHAAIRAIEEDFGRPVGILQDLQGPKLRVGKIQGGSVRLERGQAFRLDLDESEGDETRAPLPHPEVFEVLEPGTPVLLDDGKLRVKVKDAGKDFADCEVVTGGVLSDRKGVNVPGVVMPISPLTKKDREDLQFGLELGVDWVALSFVQRPEDVAEARKLIAGRAGVMVKVEKPAALQCLDRLVELADAVMIARGDLGVEVAP
jgi:pyruvate kinase